jgi:subfamily B ATP-binding cassette protein HlyB/CyaB
MIPDQATEPSAETAGQDDSGLIAYATLLALHRIAVDPAQLRHSLGHDRGVDADDLKRIAKRQDDVRAKSVRSSYDKLRQTPLPALANGPSGWFIIARISDDEALIQPPCHSSEGVQPQIMKVDRAALEAMWSGELLLVTTREGIGNDWFIMHLLFKRPETGTFGFPF